MPRKIKNRSKKVKKQSNNTRTLFRRDARKTMRTMLTALQRVTMMREECDKIKNYPVAVSDACLAKEQEALAKITAVEPKANEIIAKCDPEVPMATWEEESLMDVSNLSIELENEADVVVAMCVEAAATLQI